MPVFYGAQSYDGILLIDSAVRAVKGNLANKKGMVAAMKKADFASTAASSATTAIISRSRTSTSKDRDGPGRPGSGDGDPEDGVHQPQGLVFQGMRDEVIFRLRRIESQGARNDPRPFLAPHPVNLVLVLEQTLNGLQLGVMLFLMAAGLTLVFAS